MILSFFDTVPMIIILFIVGVVFIAKGGDWFVDAASWIAEKSGIPKFIIGATIVSIATTLPEQLVSFIAAAEGNGFLKAGDAISAYSSVDMAIGNAIGSINCNIGIVMAISLLFIPSIVNRKEFFVKPLLLIAAIILLFFGSLSGKLTIIGAILVLIVLIVFIVENVITSKKQMMIPEENSSIEEKEKTPTTKKEVIINIVKFIVGTLGIVIGARLLVDKGEAIAVMLNVPTKIIALTMVAIGTSLPELVTTIIAISKKESDLSVGNIIGANIIDITLILPVCSFIFGSGLPVNNEVLFLDMAVALILTLIAVLPTIIRGKFSRVQGALLLATYIAYIALSATNAFGF